MIKSPLKDAPRKKSRIFKAEIKILNKDCIINKIELFNKIIEAEPMMNCIVSLDVNTIKSSKKSMKLFFDTVHTSWVKWKSVQIYKFLEDILVRLLSENGFSINDIYISIIKPDHLERGIKWATKDYDPCYTKNYKTCQFSETFRIEMWANNLIKLNKQFDETMVDTKSNGFNKTNEYLKNYFDERRIRYLENLMQ